MSANGERPSTVNEQKSNLKRCLACKYATEKNPQKGTLLCTKHDMLINADADEIPDDCPEFSPMNSETPEHAKKNE